MRRADVADRVQVDEEHNMIVAPARTVAVVSAQPGDGFRAASALGADEVVVDLTAVAADARDDILRLQVATAIGGLTWRAPTISVQTAPFGTKLFDEEIIQLVIVLAGGLDRLVVPEVSEAEHIVAASELLDEVEAEFPVQRHLGLEARIAGGVDIEQLEEIVSASPRLAAVVFDAGPYLAAAELAMTFVVRRAGLSVIRGMPNARHEGLLPDHDFDGHWRVRLERTPVNGPHGI